MSRTIVERMALPTDFSTQAVPSGRLRVIIIGDSRSAMARIRRMLAKCFPHVEVTEFDPEQQGKPGPDFGWSEYDVALMDYQLGIHENGLDWLETYRSCPGFPPTVLMSDEGDEYIAARSIKLGACDYIKKQDITTARLSQLVGAAVHEVHSTSSSDVTLREARVSPHLAILARLAARSGGSVAEGADAVGYRFVRLIGQGASSRIYLAERSTDSTTLVLKVIDTAAIADPQIVERFIREAEIVASISSPYVVRFFDHGLTQTYGYIAMEFFTRGDLKQRIEPGIAFDDALKYTRHIARGLHAIHQQGIVHRDLKPGNIMFRADDSLALADFGISKRDDQQSELTNQGSVLGTPNYLSPEQALGRDVGYRADLYSAGVVLFEMLAGRKPFSADTPSALVYQHVYADIPKLPEHASAFQPLINSLLAKDPDERMPSAYALVAAIDRLQSRRAA
ncbi:MAG: protein kinase [Proteobacteria bacterium]|nr:protein kinase [Pseudomonadota bacterium]